MKERFESLVEHLVSSGFFLEEAVEILERTMIQRTLRGTNGNQSAASKALGIHRNTLQRKIDHYKLDGARPRKKPARPEARYSGGRPVRIAPSGRTG
jgi:DNA-binding NtrC family response regulator